MARISLVSPLGPLTLREERGALASLTWEGPANGFGRGAQPTSPLLAAAKEQLEAYFTGRLDRFDLPLAPAGTRFQRSVWELLAEVPYGATDSYGSLARRLRTAPRAVGAACARNPIPIVIPCHRVLGAGERLGGYSGRGGLETKRFLLRLEGTSAP